MTQSVVLSAETRDRKTNPRRVRAKGQIPAICYGAGEPELLLALNPKEFAAAQKQGSFLMTLKVSSGQERAVILREVQRHPIRRDVPVHIDFLAVRLDKPMRIEVPLVLSGNPIGVKMGGVLQQVRRVITVECLPNSIPEKVTHDISALDINGTVHVADLRLPEGVKAVFTDNFTVANLQELTDGKEAAPAEAAAAAAPAAKAPAKAAAAKPAAGGDKAAAAKPAAAPAAKKK
jgi:large subunit ribosomal protein L25